MRNYTKDDFVIILVTGGRVGRNLTKQRVYAVMDHIAAQYVGKILVVIHGGAVWTDTWCGEWARDKGHIPRETKIDGEKDGYTPSAPFNRNQRMLDENPDIAMCLGFPGGGGTFDMMERSHAAGVPVADIKIEHNGDFEIKWWPQ